MKRVLYAISYIVLYFIMILGVTSFLDVLGLLDGSAFGLALGCTIGHCIVNTVSWLWSRLKNA